jgi:hypothetical protein
LREDLVRGSLCRMSRGAGGVRVGCGFWGALVILVSRRRVFGCRLGLAGHNVRGRGAAACGAQVTMCPMVR